MHVIYFFVCSPKKIQTEVAAAILLQIKYMKIMDKSKIYTLRDTINFKFLSCYK